MKTPLYLILILLILASVSSAQNDVEMVYWRSDKKECAICDKYTYQGDTYRTFETKDFGVVVIATKNKKLTYSSILIENFSDSRIEFDPMESIMYVFKKKSDKTGVEYLPITPMKAAKKMKGNQFFKNFLSGMAGAAATRTVQTNSEIAGTVRDNRGNSADYEGEVNSTTTVPDKEARAKANAQIADRNRRANNRKNYFLTNGLLKNTIFPKQKLSGNIYFKKQKGAYFYIGIKINNRLFLTAYE